MPKVGNLQAGKEVLPLPLVTAVSAVGYMLGTPVVSVRYSFMS